MATSKSKSARKPSAKTLLAKAKTFTQPLTSDYMRQFGMANIDILAENFNKLIHVPFKVAFRFNWEFESFDGNQFVYAQFTGQELLKIAAESGRLWETTSGERRVPKGRLPDCSVCNLPKIRAVEEDAGGAA